jgi:serine protease Do
MKKILPVLSFVAVLTACQIPVRPAAELAATAPLLSDVVARIDRNGASVVDISASVIRPQPIREAEVQWMHQFFPRIPPSPRSHEAAVVQNVGAGVIISSDGLILANAHVVAGAGEVTVRLVDRGETYPAQVIGFDRFTDVALLKINAIGLPVASLGRSERLKAGEWVAAIGSLTDSPNMISAGVVRERMLDDPFIPLIRTDMMTSPAAMSGPLVNANGEVVGISSSVVGRDGAGRDGGLAVPIEVALDVAHHLRAYGEVRRGRLGIRVEEITPGAAEALNFPHNGGLVVAAVTRGGPAHRAGVAVGDVILQVNDARVHGPLDFPRNAASIKPGTPIKLRVWRRGLVKDVTAVVPEVPSVPFSYRS